MNAPIIKPCPFCGSEVPYIESSFIHTNGYKYGAVMCGCGAQGPDVRTGYKEWSVWAFKAIEEWNKRI